MTEWILGILYFQTRLCIGRWAIATEQEQAARTAKHNPLQSRYRNIGYIFVVFFNNPWCEQFGIVSALMNSWPRLRTPKKKPCVDHAFFLRVIGLLCHMMLLVFGWLKYVDILFRAVDLMVFAPFNTTFFIEWSPQFWLKPLFGFAKYRPDDPQTFAGQRPESCRSHSGEGGGGRMLFRFGAKAAIQGL